MKPDWLCLRSFQSHCFYDAMISSYLAGLQNEKFPEQMIVGRGKVYDLRYGENPHQKASFYKLVKLGTGLPDAKQHNGKELSYNNIIDT